MIIDSFSLYKIDVLIKTLQTETEPEEKPPAYRYKPPPEHGLKGWTKKDIKEFINKKDKEKLLNSYRYLIAVFIYLSRVFLKDVAIAIKSISQTGSDIDPRTVLLDIYYKYLLAFDKKAANTLPPYRETDHKIEMLLSKTPPAGPLYNMSLEELQVLRK